MPARIFAGMTKEDLSIASELLSEYGKLFVEAVAAMKNPTRDDGLKTLHANLKAVRRILRDLIGETRLPDDSAFDDLIQKKVVDSGLSPDYDVRLGRVLSGKRAVKVAAATAKAKQVASPKPDYVAKQHPKKKET